MSDVEIRVTETGLRAVNRRFGQTERQLNKTGRAGARMGRMISGGMSRARAGVGRLTAAAAAMGAAFTVKSIIDFDNLLARIQADANLTTAEMEKMRKSILKTQSAFAISKKEIAAALKVLQDEGNLAKLFKDRIAELGRVMKATGASGADVGATLASLVNNFKKTPDEAVKILKALAIQADQGTINMAKLAAQIKPLAGIAEGANQKLVRMGALFQVIGKVAASPEQARTQLEALISALQQQHKKLKKVGVEVFKIDPATGKQVMRDLPTIMAEVFKRSKGKMAGKTGLLTLLGGREEAKRAALALRGTFDPKTGKLGGKFASILGASTKGGGDAEIARKMKSLTGGIGKEAFKAQQALFKLEEQIQLLGKRAMKFVAANPLKALGIGIGGYAAVKGGGAILGRLLGGRKGGGLGGGAGRPIPVYVVNQPVGGGVGGAAAGKKGGGIGGAIATGAGALIAGEVAARAGQYAAEQKRAIVIKKLGEAGAHRQRQQAAVNITRQAAQLAALSRKGVTGFQGAGGKRQELTQQNVMATLQANAKRSGIDAETFKKMIPLLQGILEGVKKGPAVKVAPAGVGTLKTQRSRGGKQ
jgi:TP901 family phage tail tape measure protein